MAQLLDLAVQAGMTALVALLLVCALLGAAVALRPALLARLKTAAERRYSMRRATRRLDVPRNIDPLFYRHHRVAGAVVVALAVFLLYVLVFEETGRWQALVADDYRQLAAILVEFAHIVVWIASILALIVGTIVFVRPSALKAVERRANRWVTTRPYTRGLEREHTGLDERLARHPRVWGTIIAIAGLVSTLLIIASWPI